MSNPFKNLRTYDIEGAAELPYFEKLATGRIRRDLSGEEITVRIPRKAEVAQAVRMGEIEHPDSLHGVNSLMIIGRPEDPASLEGEIAEILETSLPHFNSLTLHNQLNMLSDLIRLRYLKFDPLQRICHDIKSGYNSSNRGDFIETHSLTLNEAIQEILAEKAEPHLEELSSLLAVALAVPVKDLKLCGELYRRTLSYYHQHSNQQSHDSLVLSAVKSLVTPEIAFSPDFWSGLGIASHKVFSSREETANLLKLIGDLKLDGSGPSQKLRNSVGPLIADERTALPQVVTLCEHLKNLGFLSERVIEEALFRFEKVRRRERRPASINELATLAELCSGDATRSPNIWRALFQDLTQTEPSNRQRSDLYLRLFNTLGESVRAETIPYRQFSGNFKAIHNLTRLLREQSPNVSQWPTSTLIRYIGACETLRVLDPKLFDSAAQEIMTRLESSRFAQHSYAIAGAIARSAVSLRECSNNLFNSLLEATNYAIKNGDLAIAGRICGHLAILAKVTPERSDVNRLVETFLILKEKIPGCTHHWPDRSFAFTLTASHLLDIALDDSSMRRMSKRSQQVVTQTRRSQFELEVQSALEELGLECHQNILSSNDDGFSENINLLGWNFDFILRFGGSLFSLEAQGDHFHQVSVFDPTHRGFKQRVDGKTLIKSQISSVMGITPIEIWESQWQEVPQTGNARASYILSQINPPIVEA